VSQKRLTIAIVTSSLKVGGMERVASRLANELSEKPFLKVIVIALSNRNRFYKLSPKVEYYHCNTSEDLRRVGKALSYICYLRKILKKLSPKVMLSFGDRYNHIALLSSVGLDHFKFISNRQNPHLSNGKMIDMMNSITYKWADGIIVQTSEAKDVLSQKYPNNNIQIIPNPIKQVKTYNSERRNVILNVGRFGDSKNQSELVEVFGSLLNKKDWKVHFYGDGPKKPTTRSVIDNKSLSGRVYIFPFTCEIEKIYKESSIFAFTSLSEGFPNALAEAMASGCACIAYDCVAGPSDIIDDGINGFLIPVGDEEQYKEKLQLLMEDEELRRRFGAAAQEKIKQFEASKIARRFYEFITEPLE